MKLKEPLKNLKKVSYNIKERFKCGRLGHRLELREPRISHFDCQNVFCFECNRVIGSISTTHKIEILDGKKTK